MASSTGNPVIQVDVNRTIEPGYSAIVRDLGTLDAEQSQIVRDVLHRSTELSLLSMGATPDQLKEMQVERGALKATLTTLGEEKAARADRAIDNFIWSLAMRWVDFGLNRVGL